MPAPSNSVLYGTTSDTWTWTTGGNPPTFGTAEVYSEVHTYYGDRTDRYYWKRRQKGIVLPLNAYVRTDVVIDKPLAVRTRMHNSYNSSNTYVGWTKGVTVTHLFPAYGEVGVAGYQAYPGGVVMLSAHSLMADEVGKAMNNDPSLLAHWPDLLNGALAGLNPNTDIGPFLAGLGQTRKMITKLAGNLLSFVVKLWKLIKSGKVRELHPIALLKAAQDAFKLRNRKDIASVYLEVIYGWRPLVGDLDAILKRLNALSNQVPLPELLRSSRNFAAGVDVDVTRVFYASAPGRWRGTQQDLVTVQVVGRVGVGYKALAVGRSHAATASFSTNPLSTLWDITPWSFMIDKLVDIGTFLEAAQVGLYAKVDGLCKSRVILINASCTATASIVGSPGTGAGDSMTSFTFNSTASTYEEHRIREPVGATSTLPNEIRTSKILSAFWEIVALIVQKAGRR